MRFIISITHHSWCELNILTARPSLASGSSANTPYSPGLSRLSAHSWSSPQNGVGERRVGASGDPAIIRHTIERRRSSSFVRPTSPFDARSRSAFARRRCSASSPFDAATGPAFSHAILSPSIGFSRSCESFAMSLAKFSCTPANAEPVAAAASAAPAIAMYFSVFICRIPFYG